MPSYILKPDPDVDLYCEWSTIVDNLTSSGTRQEYLNRGEDPTRLDRADRTGTSCKGFEFDGDGFQEGAYAETGFVVTNMKTRKEPFRWLPRKNLLAYVQAVRDNDYARAESDELTEPIND